MINKKDKLNIIIDLRNSEYIKSFLDYGLPSQLAEKNLPLFSDYFILNYFIHIKKEDYIRVRNDLLIRNLRDYTNVSFEFSDPNESFENLICDFSNKALRSKSFFIILEPNCIYSNGSIYYLKNAIEKNVDCFYAVGIEVESGSISQHLEYLGYRALNALNLSSAKLVSLGVEFMHSEERSAFWSQITNLSKLKKLFINVTSNSFLVYALYPDLLMARPKFEVNTIRSLADYYKKAWKLYSYSQYLTKDSDEFFFLRLNPRGYAKDIAAYQRLDVKTITTYAIKTCNFSSISNLKTPVFIHASKLNSLDLRLKEDFDLFFQSAVVEPILNSFVNRFRFYYNKFQHFLGLLRVRLNKITFKEISRKLSLWCAVTSIVDFFLVRFNFPRNLILKLDFRIRKLAIKNSVLRQSISESLTGGLLNERKKLAVDYLMNGHIENYEILSGPLNFNENDANKIQISRNLFNTGILSLNNGNLEYAERAFEYSNQFDAQSDNIFYLNLVKTLIALKNQAFLVSSKICHDYQGCVKSVFASVVWGDQYIDDFMNYTVRSLLASDNIPSLKNQKLFFSIISTDEGVLRIKNSPVFETLKKYVEVIFFKFPVELTKDFNNEKPTYDFYRLYGALDHINIHFAKFISANLYFVVADSLYSNGSIRNLDKHINDGSYACVSASLVSNKETLLPSLDILFSGKRYIDLTSRQLANLCLNHLHNYVWSRLVIPGNKNFDKYPRELYFPAEEGIIVHAIYQHPWVVSADALKLDFELDYFIVDSKFLSRIFTNQECFEKLKVVKDSDEVFISNFAPKMRIFETTNRPLNVNDFVSVHLESSSIHHYIMEHRQIIKCETNLRSSLNPDDISKDFLDNLRSRIDQEQRGIYAM
jgi:hypothetical protein